MGRFDAEWRSAYLAQLKGMITRCSSDDLDLLPFAETVAALGQQSEESLGLLEVPIGSIVGSVSRVGDFDRRFRPRNRCLRDRWEALANLERDLPPIKLIQLGELFFVEDGHHRVSIARSRNVRSIRADVHRIRTIACANRCLTLADLRAKTAERLFLERVPLPDDVRIHLKLDRPAEWRLLAEAAEAWGFRQNLAGISLADRCKLAEKWWCEEVVPTVMRLRLRGISTSSSDAETYAQEMRYLQDRLLDTSATRAGSLRDGGLPFLGRLIL